MISKKLAKRWKDSAVSPVIATILMVAITVVLAAVLYVMVSGFTHNPGSTQSVGLTSVQNATQPSGYVGYVVTVSSTSTSNIGLSGLKIVISGSGTMDGSYALTANSATSGVGFWVLSGNSASYLNPGDTITISSTGTLSGATVTLYSGNSQLGQVTL